MEAADLLDAVVGEVLASRPCAARVFVDRGMGCVGCPFASFETVAEVAAVYGFDPHQLAAELRDAGVQAPGASGGVTS